MKRFIIGALAATCLATGAQAVVYTVAVTEASGAGAFPATKASAVTLAARPDASAATFTYNGPLTFSDTQAQNTTNAGDLNSVFFAGHTGSISGYLGAGPASPVYGAGGANFNTLAGFLATSGSVANYGYGSLYDFVSAVGSYGGQILRITHDDGVSVYANGSLVALPGTTAAPTQAITESVVLPTNTTVYEIVYARENGTPSVLNVTSVPEPASWAMMVGGFGVLGAALRRSRPARPDFA